jgi:hypothetical protein
VLGRRGTAGCDVFDISHESRSRRQFRRFVLASALRSRVQNFSGEVHILIQLTIIPLN